MTGYLITTQNTTPLSTLFLQTNCNEALRARKLGIKYLNWDPSDTPKCSVNDIKNERFDIIVGADILYEPGK